MIGEPENVGKTAIAEGLALRIVQKKSISCAFRQACRNAGSGFTGGRSTKYRGQFEEKNEGGDERAGKISGCDPVSSMSYTQSWARVVHQARWMLRICSSLHCHAGKSKCIVDYYAGRISPVHRERRRDWPVISNGDGQTPLPIEETIQILTNIKDKYEDHHHVNYTPEAISTAVKLSEKIYHRPLPGPDKSYRCTR